MKFAFIQDHSACFPIVDMCRVLHVSKSGFYRWHASPVSRRERARVELADAIARVHESSRGVYGSPRVHAALVQEGRSVCRNTVAKVMKQRGIQARTQRFKVRTTDARHAHAIAPNVLNRAFDVPKINTRWAADITYIHTDEGVLYLAGVMDLCSRKIVGWSMAQHMRSELACDALRMALASRKPGKALLHHSDRGVQYACEAYQSLLQEHDITVSMSRGGDCYDNAPTESLWGKLKTELVYLAHFTTREAARAAIFDYIECFYNRTRLHSSLGYQSPERFEAALRE